MNSFGSAANVATHDFDKAFLLARERARYAIPVFAVGVASATIAVLRHFSVRDPIILIYLAAIAVSSWWGQRGPGLFAFGLSTVCLVSNFLVLEHRWSQIALYDGPTLCLYFVFAWWIQAFAESRHHLETVLRRNGNELETAVKARTLELTQVNMEYKVSWMPLRSDSFCSAQTVSWNVAS